MTKTTTKPKAGRRTAAASAAPTCSRAKARKRRGTAPAVRTSTVTAAPNPAPTRSAAAAGRGKATEAAEREAHSAAPPARTRRNPQPAGHTLTTPTTAPPTATVLAQLAALKDMPTPALKAKWRDLFDTAPPPYNRRFLESRLAYRIQELAYGGLKPETVARLRVLGEQLDGGNIMVRKQRGDPRPIAGTRLIREWQGVEHTVTVRTDDFDYGGRPYKSLSAVARAITGTRWNGWVFFGLKSARGRE